MATAKEKAAKKAKDKKAKDKWLKKDATYLEQKSVSNAAYKRFLSGQGINKTQFNVTHKRNLEDNTRNRKKSLTDVNEGFAARGMASSGGFQKSRDETSDQYARQRTGMVQNKTNFNQDQSYEKTNANAQKNETVKRALRDATERYAQRQYLI